MLSLMTLSAVALARTGEEPLSVQLGLLEKSAMKVIELDPVDVDARLKEFAPKPFEAKPLRFAIGQLVKVSPDTHGTWRDVPGGKLWTLRFHSEGATDINFAFTNIALPKGAKLYMLSFADDPVYYDGPYGQQDVKKLGEFWTAPVPGGDAALELFVPTGSEEKVTLELTQVATGFRDVFKRYGGYGLVAKQGACNNDVVCPEGDPWRDEIRSVAAYAVNGIDACTGTMVMDVPRSFTPYFLTAYHCGVTAANAAAVVTFWNYESMNCGDLGGGSRMDSVSGTIFRSRKQDVDMNLLELASTPPEDYDVYWSGWDRSGDVPNGAVAIHHPMVDEKAISFNVDALTTVNSCINGGGSNTHWEVDNWEDGTTEPGSSGSGIWDPDSHLLVGFLSGGLAACDNNLYDCYGKFSVGWDDGGNPATSLANWLDPEGTGAMSVSGSNPAPFVIESTPVSVGVCSPGDAEYVLDLVQSDPKFDEMVTLSTMDLPAGASDSFSANMIVPPGTSTLTISDTDMVAAGQYQFDVVGTATSFATELTLGLNVATAIAGQVVLDMPADGAINVPVAPTFSWNAQAAAATYLLEVATDAGFSDIVASEVVSAPDTSVTLTEELDSNTIHYWRVTASNGCGDSTASATFSFTTLPLPGDCPVGMAPVRLFNFTFESGAEGWVSSGTASTWALSTTNPAGGSQHWHADNSDSISDQRLRSPSITLPTTSSPLTLQFMNEQQLESNGSAACYDGGLLEIAENGGAFVQVPGAEMGTDPYDGPIDDGFDNPISGLDAWCGDPQPYLNSIVNIDGYAGSDVQLRFRLGTDSSVDRPGWDIDDVQIMGCGPDEYFTDGFGDPN
ncbi:MAG: hypothetical protein DHS20C11_15670 [Lysobacteraceae bacterium]|nr:MAG: hypothetical protein DHS20C11_15670 [Xanthomonadaceae bacterium]